MLDRLHLAMNARVNDPMMANASNISAITAYALEGNREWCIEADMNDYIAKPLQKGELDEVLQEVWPKGSVKLGTPKIKSAICLTRKMARGFRPPQAFFNPDSLPVFSSTP